LELLEIFTYFSFLDVVVSVEKDVAATFKLTKYNQVIVTKIDPEVKVHFSHHSIISVLISVALQSVALDLVEVTFKEQYVSRSDMWRFRKHLVSMDVTTKYDAGLTRYIFHPILAQCDATSRLFEQEN